MTLSSDIIEEFSGCRQNFFLQTQVVLSELVTLFDLMLITFFLLNTELRIFLVIISLKLFYWYFYLKMHPEPCIKIHVIKSKQRNKKTPTKPNKHLHY